MASRVVALLFFLAAVLQLASSCNLAWNGNQACNTTNCLKTLGTHPQTLPAIVAGARVLPPPSPV